MNENHSNIYGSTVHTYNTLVRQYKHKLICFEEFKKEVISLLSKPIDWYYCNQIVNFDININFLYIKAITRKGSVVKAYIYH